MITLDAFLVFLVAASLPIIYLLILRHFLEGETPASTTEVKRESRQEGHLEHFSGHAIAAH